MSAATFENYFLNETYKKVRGLGDRLPHLKDVIDWEPFRPIVASVYHDNDVTGGRPHTDEIVIVRALLLQSMYNLSDPELEFQINDRLSFLNFVGFPDDVPDFTTIWQARERLKATGADKLIWVELQRQLDKKGFAIRKGVIQDATFIEADVGKKRQQDEKRKKRNGEEVNRTEKQKSHIDKDGSYAVKNAQVHYGYKTHAKVDVDYHFIRDLHVTTASVHDSQIDLVKDGDGAAYRDKGYFGAKLSSRTVLDKTMKRAVRGRKLNGGEQKRNKAISRIRTPGERPFSVKKCVFHGGWTQVKTLARVRVKEMFSCFAYDLYQLFTIERKRIAKAIEG